MSDDLFDDIPLPPEPTPDHSVKDEFDYDVAFNFAFVGVGQCGGNLAKAFKDVGYGRVCAINTALQDLSSLDLDDAQKLDLGGSGAGKDPTVAAAAIEGKDEDVYDLLKRNWGNEVDYAFICLGAGGGTGSGASDKVIEVAKRYLEDTKRPVRVGVIVALPGLGEGWQPAKNTLSCCERLSKAGLSPIIILDNEKTRVLYDRVPTKTFHPTVNKTMAKYFHLFNRLAVQSSEYISFDRADFGKLLDGGVVAFGAKQLTSWANESDISKVVREQLKENTLAAVDLTKGKKAGLMFVCGEPVLATVPQAVLEHGFEMFNRVLASGSTVYRGIYESGTKESMMALSLVSELPWPEDSINDLAKVAGVEKRDIDWLLG